MFKTSYNIKPIIIFALVILLGGLSLAPAAYAQTNKVEGIRYAEVASNVPTLVFPTGDIPINKVIYIWTSVAGATKYYIQVNRDSTSILNQTIASSNCSSGTCSTSPTATLANGTYKWRVRAYTGGVWRSFSAWETFSVSVGGFNSQFTSDSYGWTPLKGEWKLQSSNYYTTTGVADRASTTKHTGNFSTQTYEVKMKRQGCIGCANAILIRGDAVLDSSGWWTHAYVFNFNNKGQFSVWKDNEIALKNWTTNIYIIKNGWNTLKVTADGTALKFYINNHLVWQDTNSAYASGQVGIGMYRAGGSTGDLLTVDWAALTTSVADLGVEAIEDNQVELSGGNINVGP